MASSEEQLVTTALIAYAFGFLYSRKENLSVKYFTLIGLEGILSLFSDQLNMKRSSISIETQR